MVTEYAVIGKRLPRIDAIEKATGTARYLKDLKIAGMLYGKILRSPYAHAKILEVDTSKAEKLKGIRAVVTGKKNQGIRICLVPQLANKPPLAEERVRFIGDEIAAVAADDEEIAEEALDLIRVEYEELPGVFDPLEAIRPDATKIHKEGNIAVHISTCHGDLEKAFEDSEEIFEDHFETQAQTHCCLEPRGCIAYLDRSGHLTVWVTTQIPHPYRRMLADVLHMPLSKVRVIKVFMGGGFGERLEMDPLDIIAYFLSRETGRPVQIINTRDEQFTTGRTRYPMIIDIKTGVKKDGTILARQVRVVTDNGAYNSHGSAITMGIGTKCTYLWRVPNVKFEADVVFTNKVYGGGFRGYGNPQITFAIESQMDMIAERLGMDVKDLCLKNANYEGQVTSLGDKIISCGLRDCIEKSTEAAGWNEKRKRHRDRGIGMACVMHTGGGLRLQHKGGCNLSDVFLKMNNDGTIDLVSGMAEMGQGSDTVLVQIAAEELGLRMEDIHIITGDTSVTPQCMGAWGSREVFVAGNAVKIAAQEVKRQVLEEASKILEARLEDLVAGDRSVHVKGSSEEAVSIGQIAAACYSRGKILAGRGFYDAPNPIITDQELRTNVTYGGAPTFSFGTHVVEVEVDRRTGKVRVLNFVAAHDAGRVINPLMAEGQVEGGGLQGLGYALSESLVWDEGIVLNPNFQDYRVFYMNDVPPIKTMLLETIDPEGPYGAKGLGEMGLVPTAAAVANAIYDAVGVRIKTLPITPEKILIALREKGPPSEKQW
jgi:4-hydroxybenzoyl-CoA reductase alpha subunit